MNINLLVLIILVPILAIILLGLNSLLSPHKAYENKLSQFECGSPVVTGQTRESFQVHYIYVSMYFIILEIELLLFTPVVTVLNEIDLFGYYTAMLFFVVLIAGFIFEFGSNAISLKKISKNTWKSDATILQDKPNSNLLLKLRNTILSLKKRLNKKINEKLIVIKLTVKEKFNLFLSWSFSYLKLMVLRLNKIILGDYYSWKLKRDIYFIKIIQIIMSPYYISYPPDFRQSIFFHFSPFWSVVRFGLRGHMDWFAFFNFWFWTLCLILLPFIFKFNYIEMVIDIYSYYMSNKDFVFSVFLIALDQFLIHLLTIIIFTGKILIKLFFLILWGISYYPFKLATHISYTINPDHTILFEISLVIMICIIFNILFIILTWRIIKAQDIILKQYYLNFSNKLKLDVNFNRLYKILIIMMIIISILLTTAFMLMYL